MAFHQVHTDQLHGNGGNVEGRKCSVVLLKFQLRVKGPDLHIILWHIKVFCKVRKTRHQNPEFGPKPGEIFKKNLPKKYISLLRGVKLRNAPFLVLNSASSSFFDPLFFFFLSASTAPTYIFTVPTSTTTIITSNLVH